MKVLVIKLGALGDLARASAAFAALRQHHANDSITLLTTKPYKTLATDMGYFDNILIDTRPKLTAWRQLWQLRQTLLSQEFDRVYDLQMVDRTNFYYHGLYSKNRPAWVGTAKGCDYYYNMPKSKPHALDRFRALLDPLGISEVGLPDLRHMALPKLPVKLPQPYALLIPGASPAHGGRKRWTVEGFGDLACYLQSEGIQPVILGGPQEDNAALKRLCSDSIDLTGTTSFIDIITLATQAHLSIGNDTGPLHLAAAGHSPIVGFFSSANPPEIGGAISPKTLHIYHDDLNQLSSQSVIQKIKIFLKSY